MDTHDLENTVVAILDAEPAVADAVTRLGAAGYDYEVLAGEEGRAHLDPGGEEGVVSSIKRIIGTLGDQQRVLRNLDEALASGRSVVSVDTTPDDAAEAIEILREHGGEYVWKFGEWTYTRIGD
jgi:precorrin-6B methylase 2